MSSGLLSLNVHEPLAFEGTEICIHPDIFLHGQGPSSIADGRLGGGTRQSLSSTSNTSNNLLHHQHYVAAGGALSVSSGRLLGGAGHDHHNKALLLSHPSTTTTTAPSSNNNNNTNNNNLLLQAGDMIMIRVWDPLPAEERIIKGTPASSSRKLPSVDLLRAQSVNTCSNTSTSSPLGGAISLHTTESSNKELVPPAIGKRRLPQSMKDSQRDGTGRKSPLVVATTTSTTGAGGSETAVQSSPTADSGLQTPDNVSPQASPPASTCDTEASTAASIAVEKSMASSFRPPVVPRVRSSAGPATNNSVALGSIGSKSVISPAPPGSSHPSSNNNTNRVVTNTEALSRLRTSPPISSSVQPKPRHSRDLSDISVDTTFFPGPPVGSRRPSMDTTKTVLLGSLAGEVDDTLSEIACSHNLRLSFVMLVTEKSLKGLKASSRNHISILRQIADLYELSTYDMVTVHKLTGMEAEKALQAVSADFLLLTIKDQFLSRGELHFFQNSLVGSWIYEGQRLYEPSRGIHANAREIRHGGINTNSGIVTESTKFVYRSRSSRIFWLVQLSAEMWDYASPFQAGQKESYCEVYFDRFISFAYDLFEKWKQAEVTHSLTVVFFSRTFLTAAPSSAHGRNHDSNVQRDLYGRKYEDHCRVVIENETRTDWDTIVVRLKEAFLSYPHEVGWNLSSGVGARRPSTAGQGNLLETVNVTLNLLQYHFLDRDLHRTGNSIVVVSAGNGVFEVDKKLAFITQQRMMDNGIGSDMLSLGLPPLHVAPFFLYFNEFHEVESEIPHWIHLSFISYQSDESLLALNDAENEDSAGTAQENVDESGLTKQSPGRSVTNDDTPEVVEVESEGGNSQTFTPQRKAHSTRSGDKDHKERHLEDRDIRDILEACRPRGTGLLPPPLKSLMEMYEAGETREQSAATMAGQESGDLSIREWDGIDLDEVKNRKTLLFALERDQSKLQAPSSPPPMVEVDRLESSSTQASSFTSQIPHLMLGTSYEQRHPLAHDASSFVGRTRMQRANSIASACGSTSDRSHDNDEDEFLRVMSQSMQAHDQDKMNASGKSPKLNSKQHEFDVGTHDSHQHHSTHVPTMTVSADPSTLGTSVLGPVTVHHAAPSGGSQVALSGIGAALSQYSSNLSREVSENEMSGGLSRSFERTRTIPRTSSVGRVVSPHIEISDTAPRALSPLVLPPPIPPFHGEAPFVPSLGPFSSAERIFLRAQDIPGAVIDGGGLSATPETSVPSYIASTGQRLAHEKNVRKAVSPNTESRSILRTSVAMGQSASSASRRRTSKSPIPRRTASPNSELMLTTSRQQSGSLAKNLSAENMRRRASPSPVPRRRYGSPSSETRMTRNRRQNEGARLTTDGSRRQPSPNPVSRNRPRISSTGQQLGPRSSSHHTAAHRDSSGGTKNSGTTRRRKAINPFRQQDEVEVLARKSHNSRRWSHVFPQGEIEFKRMSGPNWKSLAAPATLPLSIDYFPPQREREHNYTFSIYNVTLSEFERNNFSSNKELLLEMVRQRITQDYQLVPSYLVDDSNEEQRSLVRNDRGVSADDSVRMYLSLGHRLQVLHYDPASDTVEVKTYMAKNSQGTNVETFKYFYKSYCRETNSYVRMVQEFKQFTSPYNWNKVDRIICGDEDREMREGMRFKRLMFAILPDRFNDVESENAYVDKFKKLLAYFEKLRAKEETKTPLKVKITTSQDKKEQGQGRPSVLSTPGIAGNSMVRFYVPFRKGGRELFEYLEVSIDSTFNTAWSYRIIFNWLVASSGKVDTQVQLLQRRCIQFRLNLITSSEGSVSKMLFLNPFRSPVIFTIMDPKCVESLDHKLAEIDFIHDGLFPTNRHFLDCIDRGEELDFGSKWSKLPVGRQFVHRTGVLYVRILQDRNGKAALVAIANNMFLLKDESAEQNYKSVFGELSKCVNDLVGNTNP